MGKHFWWKQETFWRPFIHSIGMEALLEGFHRRWISAGSKFFCGPFWNQIGNFFSDFSLFLFEIQDSSLGSRKMTQQPRL